MVPAPIQFNCASGVLEGANLWERMVALAAGAIALLVSRLYRLRQFLRRTLPSRDIAIKFTADATFEIPDGDGYWSRLLNRSYRYDSPIRSPSNRDRALDPRSHQGFAS